MYLSFICLVLTSLAVATTVTRPNFANTANCETHSMNSPSNSVGVTASSAQSCHDVIAPDGFSIQMTTASNVSTWTLYDYFYVELNGGTDRRADIFAFTSNTTPCCVVFNTSALKIQLKTSENIDIKLASYNVSMTTQSQISDCTFRDTTSHQYEQCTHLEPFDSKYTFTREILAYNEFLDRHPSLNWTVPDPWFDQSESPQLFAATDGKTLSF